MTTELKKPKLHSGYMEVAVALLINYRIQCIVPNVSYGLPGLNHECDLLALDGNNRFTEIEIKISKSDLKADFKKSHGHKSKFITRLIYAVPDFILEAAIELVPKECGIIVVKWNGYRYEASWVRHARHRKVFEHERPSQAYIRKFLELGAMRIWTLKSTLFNHKARYEKQTN